MPRPDCYFIMGGLNKKDYCIIDSKYASDMNCEVNVKTKWCTLRKPLPIARFSFGICTYGEYIIIVSGLCEVSQHDLGANFPEAILECDRYSPLNDEWSIMPDLPEGRSNPS